MEKIKNFDKLIPCINIKEALVENWWYSLYIKWELEDRINQYDSEILEKNNFDIEKTLIELWDDIIVQYILDDEMLKNYAIHYIDAEVYYSDKNKIEYLQISDRRILNEIENENIMWETYYQEAHNWIKTFEKDINDKYWVENEVLLLWRSWRHICIPLNYTNILLYKTLEKEYKELEDNFIEYINNY